MSSPVELLSLGRGHGRLDVVREQAHYSPRGQWIQGNDECRYCLGTNSVAGVVGVALSCRLQLLIFCGVYSPSLFHNYFFLNFILIYKLNIQIQISLVIGNLYLADLITGISSIKKMNE